MRHCSTADENKKPRAGGVLRRRVIGFRPDTADAREARWRPSVAAAACRCAEGGGLRPSPGRDGPFRRTRASPSRNRIRTSWVAPSGESDTSVLHPEDAALSESSYVADYGRAG